MQTIGRRSLLKLNKLTRGPKGSGSGQVGVLQSLSHRQRPSRDEHYNRAQRAGQIGPDTIILEPTRENTVIGLAVACAAKGIPFVPTIPDSTSEEERPFLKTPGARIVLTPAACGMKGVVSKTREMAFGDTRSFVPQQFQNPADPEIHRRTTTKDMWSDTDSQVQALVCGVGTGGTVT